MSGPPHGYQTGFANAQQAVMRSQFVTGAAPQIPGLMTNQQPGMVGQQGYGGGVVGMQQPLAQQQQQQQMQLQQQQQQQMQLQQQQLQMQQQAQQAQVQQQQVGGGQPPPQQQGPKEFNTASLCRYGQETVQDIVSRTQEIFQTLKVMQPPNGTSQGATMSNDKKNKMQEQLKMIRLLFKRLRVIYEKCTESCQLQGMEYMHIESLIPLKEEWDMKSEEKKTSEQYRVACDESKEVMEQVVVKNRQLKEVIDIMRRIIWEINTMLTMRRS
uniref:Mediator of RNA polymerase II transcription subunit 30 n=2 Tax=Lygus hesperus TaxID=30085 RepID=A0A0A9YWZ3_LYGHE